MNPTSQPSPQPAPPMLRAVVTAGLVAGGLELLLLAGRAYRARILLDPELASQVLPPGEAAHFTGGIPGLVILLASAAGLLTGAVLLLRAHRSGPAGRVVIAGGAGLGVLLGLWVQVDPPVLNDWAASPWAAIAYLAATVAAAAVLAVVFTGPPARLVLPIQLALVAVAVVGVAAQGAGFLVEPGGDHAPGSAPAPARRLDRPVTLRPVAAQTPGPCPAGGRGLPGPDGAACYELDEGLAVTQFARVGVVPPDPASGSTWSIQVAVREPDRVALAGLTGRIAGQQPPRNQMAVVVAGRVVTAMQVAEPISGGEMTISMGLKATRQEAERLAAAFGG
jgi:hypothetical protein